MYFLILFSIFFLLSIFFLVFVIWSFMLFNNLVGSMLLELMSVMIFFRVVFGFIFMWVWENIFLSLDCFLKVIFFILLVLSWLSFLIFILVL